MKNATAQNFSPEQNFMFDIFKTRRSVRKFKSDPIPEEHLLKILDMARTVPHPGTSSRGNFWLSTRGEK